LLGMKKFVGGTDYPFSLGEPLQGKLIEKIQLEDAVKEKLFY